MQDSIQEALGRIARPNFYGRNPFNVLDLQVKATAKQIRRRKGDLEAACFVGNGVGAFARTLPVEYKFKAPSREKIGDLFSSLEKPCERLVYEFFWFWNWTSPTPETSANNGKPDPNTDGSRAYWEESIRSGNGIGRALALHDLAVLCHLNAITRDRYRLGRGPECSKPALTSEWNAAVLLWNELSEDRFFWDLFEERINERADPRIPGTAVRDIRDALPRFFATVQAELALGFAKALQATDVERTLATAEKFFPGRINVQDALEDAYATDLSKFEEKAKAAVQESRSNAKMAFHLVDDLFQHAVETTCIAKILFPTGSPSLAAIRKAGFEGVRSCLIAYANNSQDWRWCLWRTNSVQALAQTEDERSLCEKDRKSLREFLAKQGEENEPKLRCTRCGAALNPFEINPFRKVVLHGPLRRGKNRGDAIFDTRRISVPECEFCRDGTPNYEGVDEAKLLIREGWKFGAKPSKEELEILWFEAPVPAETPEGTSKERKSTTTEQHGGIFRSNPSNPAEVAFCANCGIEIDSTNPENTLAVHFHRNVKRAPWHRGVLYDSAEVKIPSCRFAGIANRLGKGTQMQNALLPTGGRLAESRTWRRSMKSGSQRRAHAPNRDGPKGVLSFHVS